MRGRGQGSRLNDLSAVANGTTEHHTEDHPNDLLRRKNRLLLKSHSQKSAYLCAFSTPILTHHDSGNADAHVPNDVEFTVEEVLDACLTVLHTRDKRSEAVSSRSVPTRITFPSDRSYRSVWFEIRAGVCYGSTTVQLNM